MLLSKEPVVEVCRMPMCESFHRSVLKKLEEGAKDLAKLKGPMAFKAKQDTAYAPFKEKMFHGVNL